MSWRVSWRRRSQESPNPESKTQPVPLTPAREPYIPLLIADLLDVLIHEAGTPAHPTPTESDRVAFRQFSRLIAQRIHLGFRSVLQRLKEAYAHFDPDSDTYQIIPLTQDQHRVHLENLFNAFSEMLARAGFHHMSRELIEETMQGASAWGIEMDVCWDVFERVEVYYRGKGVGLRSKRVWWKMFRTEEVVVPTYRRVVIILKQRQHPRLGPGADTSHVYLKIFKDIPQMDIEMLLPGTRLRMPKFERGKLGGTALSSVVYVVYKLGTSGALPKLLSGSLLGLYSPLTLILGYGYKTIYSYQVAKRTYMLHLTQSLYYQNLDTNAGVMYRLFDDAEEQVQRQVLSAYYFLWRFGGTQGMTWPELDMLIESDLERRLGEPVEVDTRDALLRLVRFEAVQQIGDRFIAVPVNEAIDIIQHQSTLHGQDASRPSSWTMHSDLDRLNGTSTV